MESKSNKQNEVKEVSRWGWIIPVIIGGILAKLFGLLGAAVTFGSYYLLQPKIGMLGATLLSTILGFGSAIGFVVFLRGA
ncbi:hypothetical protein C0W96_02090 [Photobacterium kishitanii]|uniref:hypothetical protein n=1 Tax=Photobacterium kishitanii TaxID=318456 RepID=UPI0005D4515A|nr:hypothetical protein [Photobacterium kishitanii]KJG10729.1 hypothetical protein UB40_05065 [Photobacterium kishitanii]PSV08066.1 hypothetical protein C0W96_02090 [Photobacterium kishitanii]PSV75452.1 hypothetical protein C0W29_11320 [Photobacterium kishitanii]